MPTVDALAYNLVGHAGLVCPLMDARRNQTYTGLYSFDGNEMEVLKEQCAVGIDEIISIVNQFEQPVTFGDGVPVFQEYIAENCSVPYTFAPAHVNKRAKQERLSTWHEIFCRGQIRNRCGTQAGISAPVQAENEKGRISMISQSHAGKKDAEQVSELEE